MSDNIVALPKRMRGSEYIFVCRCGSSSFSLLGNGTIECAACCVAIDGDDHIGWYKSVENASDAPEGAPPPITHQCGNDGQFSEHLVKRRAQEADWIVHGRHDGLVSCWQRENLDTEQREEWMRKNLEIALNMLLADRGRK